MHIHGGQSQLGSSFQKKRFLPPPFFFSFLLKSTKSGKSINITTADIDSTTENSNRMYMKVLQL